MDIDKTEFLKLLQTIISRLADNSFKIKNWTITISLAISGLGIQQENSSLFLLLFASTVVFWTLDSYYLHKERGFRDLFNDILEGKRTELVIDVKKSRGVVHFLKSAFSFPTSFVYLFILLSVTILLNFLKL